MDPSNPRSRGRGPPPFPSPSHFAKLRDAAMRDGDKVGMRRCCSAIDCYTLLPGIDNLSSTRGPEL